MQGTNRTTYGSLMTPAPETYHRAARRLRALEDPKVVERIRAAEERVRHGDAPAGDTMSADELGEVIADLRARRGQPRRPLEDS